MSRTAAEGAIGIDTAIERRGLRDHVYERILERLLSGEVEPGARLSIDTIAREFHVSPTPVREAMVQLERTELVTREALKGYRVAPPLDSSQLSELFDARAMLEATAARLATPASAKIIAELNRAEDVHRTAADDIIRTVENGRRDVSVAAAYFAADTAFHRVIFEAAGNHYINQMSDSLGGQLHRMRQTVRHGVTDVREAIAEHEAVIAAFESGDPDAPERAMRHHIEQVRARSLRMAEGR